MYSKMKGLLFPDEYVIKFFFKNRLHEKAGKMLELGCGTGNNLMLFHEFGWQVTGIDMDEEALSMAASNLGLLEKDGPVPRLVHGSIERVSDLLPASSRFDVIILPNVVCYISRSAARELFKYIGKLLRRDGLVFVRTRTLSDYRYARGREVEPNGFMLATDETGETGMLNVFYNEWELVEFMKEFMDADPSRLTVLHVCFDNLQAGRIVRNSDIVLWGPRG